MRIRSKKRAARLAEAFEVDLVADAVAGAREPDAVFRRHGLQVAVVVGVFEAQAIALAVEKIKMPRPITHDLFVNFLEKLNIIIEKIIVDDLIEGTFFAKIFYIKNNDRDVVYQIDSRPSDAIALALRSKADIYIAEKVLRMASQPIDDKDQHLQPQPRPDEEAVSSNLVQILELQEQLQTAIEKEDYETAARLRDKINTLENERAGEN